ncbi:MAG TPA: hypothetical protein PKA53_01345 [Sphingobacterium sp.]|nr:hypothetical protein [Sphingobacterium sp.]
MNYNILAYLIFGAITIYIILRVGKLFHRNGRIFILSFFDERKDLTDTTNNLLLVGYYLFNIGYTILQFSTWDKVSDWSSLISSVSIKTGLLVLLLAGLHFNNMFIIYLLSKSKTHSFTIKQ